VAAAEAEDRTEKLLLAAISRHSSSASGEMPDELLNLVEIAYPKPCPVSGRSHNILVGISCLFGGCRASIYSSLAERWTRPGRPER